MNGSKMLQLPTSLECIKLDCLRLTMLTRQIKTSRVRSGVCIFWHIFFMQKAELKRGVTQREIFDLLVLFLNSNSCQG